MRVGKKLFALLVVALAIALVPAAVAQETVTQKTAAPDAAKASASPASATQTPAVQTADVESSVKLASEKKSAKKKGKEVYTGPTEIIVQQPTPMLDETGSQRLDPDGKPMFNLPVKQQRDKRGHPLFDEKGKPVFQTASELGYDEHGHKLHAKKEKPPKMTPVTIERGTYSIDGIVGKAALNYDIADLKYVYLFAPGMGVAVISNVPFPGAALQKGAFNGKTLTITAEDHTLQLASDKQLLPGKQKAPQPAYVLLDREFQLPSWSPVMGYGDTLKRPYAWPGSKLNPHLAGVVEDLPPAPALRPALALVPCPKGQMRLPGPTALPGQTVPVRPCVSIAQGEAADASLAAATARKQPPQEVSASAPAATH